MNYTGTTGVLCLSIQFPIRWLTILPAFVSTIPYHNRPTISFELQKLCSNRFLYRDQVAHGILLTDYPKPNKSLSRLCMGQTLLPAETLRDV